MKKIIFSVLATATLATFIATSNASAATNSYKVQTGDTLWKIATKYKVTVDELKASNKLTSESIKINQKLTIPAKLATSKQSIVVKKPVVEKITLPVVVQTNKKETTSAVISELESSINSEVLVKALTPEGEKMLLSAINAATPLVDTPYVWAGITTEGFDCSGFIYYVFNSVGVTIERTDTIGMHNNSSIVEEPVPGDLVFFQNTYRSGISHAGIYLGEGKFIHAGSKKVEISSIDSAYWKDKFTSFKRFNSLVE